MKIAIIGTGYVGLVTGTCLAEIGHEVTCLDINQEKIEQLKLGKIPIYEPGLEEIVLRNSENGRLIFSSDIPSGIKNAEVIFSAVGTPQGNDGRADISAVFKVAEVFAANLNSYKVFVNKSTVPVGTSEKVAEIIKKTCTSDKNFSVVDNPEFLREGNAIEDFMVPDRIIVGVEDQKAKEIMEHVYRPLARAGRPLMFTDIKSAETIKYAANSFLATKISFINDVANFCEAVGADVKEVSKGIGLDKRIGPRFLHAGIGYGGSCFPKDVQAFIQSGYENGIRFKILESVEEVNNSQKSVIVRKIKSNHQSIKGYRIGIWGLAFKPRTDDMREAPSIPIINMLLEEDVSYIQLYDPVAMKNAKSIFSDARVSFCENPFAAAEKVDILLILTEWDEFRAIDLKKVASIMRGKEVYDGRNLYEFDDLNSVGLNYFPIGRCTK